MLYDSYSCFLLYLFFTPLYPLSFFGVPNYVTQVRNKKVMNHCNYVYLLKLLIYNI